MPTPSDDRPARPRPGQRPLHPLRPLVTEHVRSTDRVTVALHDLGGAGPTVLFCHPTGFLGMTWAPLATALARHARSWALDFRGHGDSTLPATGSQDWRGMAHDILAVVDHLGVTPIYGVGHSMGGAALALAEQMRPGTWEALWLYEPILFPSADGDPRPEANPMATAARRRRAVFPDRETARQNYAAKPPLSVLHPDALDAYVTFGLRDRDDGMVELKCSPETEARTFEGAYGTNIFAGLSGVRCPTTVAAGGDTSPPASMAPLTAEALPKGRFERMTELSHFGPMEDPTTVASRIAPLLAPHM